MLKKRDLSKLLIVGLSLVLGSFVFCACFRLQPRSVDRHRQLEYQVIGTTLVEREHLLQIGNELIEERRSKKNRNQSAVLKTSYR